ncbi:MAG: S1C family serine protease [Chloroflexota bacterium]|nr:S1C family serine protease [Chloroflexota bacterium]
MIESRDTSSNAPPSEELSFTRTAVALLLLGSLFVGALAGAVSAVVVGRVLQRPQVITATSGGNSSPMDAVEQVEPATVAISMQGVKPSAANARANSPTRAALGMGFVLDLDGHILTTRQVAKADRLQVVFHDGRAAVAQLVGQPDKATGLAVLKVSASVPKRPTFGNVAELRVGEQLVSMGTMLRSFQRTTDVGHVAALGQTSDLGGGQLVDNLIQTDAVAPEGAAGGPVLNARGEVVGIMVAPDTQPGGWSLVLPMETAQRVAARIIKGGSASQASLGVQAINITPEIAQSQNLPRQAGALVNAVWSRSSDARKLQKRDIIISVNGLVLNEQRTLESVLVAFRPGDKVNLQIVRREKVVRLAVRLVAKPPPVATPTIPAGVTP